MEAGEVAPERRGAGLGDERDGRREGDPGLERVRELRQRRRPGTLALAQAALAPPPRPDHRHVRTRDRPGEREHRNVNERPHEHRRQSRRGEHREHEERRTQRQLALTHQTR